MIQEPVGSKRHIKLFQKQHEKETNKILKNLWPKPEPEEIDKEASDPFNLIDDKDSNQEPQEKTPPVKPVTAEADLNPERQRQNVSSMIIN